MNVPRIILFMLFNVVINTLDQNNINFESLTDESCANSS